MHIMPEQCAAVYDCLLHFPPFKAMRLPPADEVEFKVTNELSRQGYCTINVGRADGHEIGVSNRWVGEYASLVQLVAHEMIHMHQWVRRTDTSSMHNAEYRKIAKDVCRKFQWDYKQFVTT